MTNVPLPFSNFGEYSRFGLLDVKVGTPVMVRMPLGMGAILRIETITQIRQRQRITSDGGRWSVNGLPWGVSMPLQARCETITDYMAAREAVRQNEAGNDLALRRERIFKRLQVAYPVLDLFAVIEIEKVLDAARDRALASTITEKVAPAVLASTNED